LVFAAVPRLLWRSAEVGDRGSAGASRIVIEVCRPPGVNRPSLAGEVSLLTETLTSSGFAAMVSPEARLPPPGLDGVVGTGGASGALAGGLPGGTALAALLLAQPIF
jgi:hypothetical protein